MALQPIEIGHVVHCRGSQSSAGAKGPAVAFTLPVSIKRCEAYNFRQRGRRIMLATDNPSGHQKFYFIKELLCVDCLSSDFCLESRDTLSVGSVQVRPQPFRFSG